MFRFTLCFNIRPVNWIARGDKIDFARFYNGADPMAMRICSIRAYQL
jgi:hypothetical protein